MTAYNINIEDFVEMLIGLQEEGVKMINLDMLPDENHPNMNKMIIHPLYPNSKKTKKGLEIRNIDVDTDNNDIFGLFDKIV